MIPVPVAASPPAAAASPFRRLVIAVDRCKGCELCLTACPSQVLAIDRGRVNALGYNPVCVVDMAACTSCAICARVCPDVVFTVLAPVAPTRDANTAPARPCRARPCTGRMPT
jgi:2-oxoglutarate ferredoxin oxidoreductase subunit delta